MAHSLFVDRKHGEREIKRSCEPRQKQEGKLTLEIGLKNVWPTKSRANLQCHNNDIVAQTKPQPGMFSISFVCLFGLAEGLDSV